MTGYAVIRTSGKLYPVKAGDIIKIDGHLEQDKQLDKLFEVLLYDDGATTLIGHPTLKNVKVKSKLVETIRGPKIKVRKFKPKVRYRLNKGYRQNISRIKIEKIDLVKS